MKTVSNIKNIFSEKIAGFMEKTPGVVAFSATLLIIAGIIT
jgi:hypothetical protein